MSTHREQITELQTLLGEVTVLNSVLLGARSIANLNPENMPATIIEIGDLFTDRSRSQILDRESLFPVVIGIFVHDNELTDQIMDDAGILNVYTEVWNKLLMNPALNDTCVDFQATNIKHEHSAGQFDMRSMFIELQIKTWYRSPYVHKT